MEIYLATGNQHKLEEILEMAHHFQFKANLYGANKIGGMPDVQESGETFEENALIKARALLPSLPGEAWVLADDSGLVVDALKGEPGVHSARYAGPGAIAAANNMKLLQALHDVPEQERSARFLCVLALLNNEGECHLFTGVCEGHIMTSPSGLMGFGYDPLFRPAGYSKTFADLGSHVKNELSHRARAMAKLAEFLNQC